MESFVLKRAVETTKHTNDTKTEVQCNVGVAGELFDLHDRDSLIRLHGEAHEEFKAEFISGSAEFELRFRVPALI